MPEYYSVIIVLDRQLIDVKIFSDYKKAAEWANRELLDFVNRNCCDTDWEKEHRKVWEETGEQFDSPYGVHIIDIDKHETEGWYNPYDYDVWIEPISHELKRVGLVKEESHD